jgi:hypothetical protein
MRVAYYGAHALTRSSTCVHLLTFALSRTPFALHAHCNNVHADFFSCRFLCFARFDFCKKGVPGLLEEFLMRRKRIATSAGSKSSHRGRKRRKTEAGISKRKARKDSDSRVETKTGNARRVRKTQHVSKAKGDVSHTEAASDVADMDVGDVCILDDDDDDDNGDDHHHHGTASASPSAGPGTQNLLPSCGLSKKLNSFTCFFFL